MELSKFAKWYGLFYISVCIILWILTTFQVSPIYKLDEIKDMPNRDEPSFLDVLNYFHTIFDTRISQNTFFHQRFQIITVSTLELQLILLIRYWKEVLLTFFCVFLFRNPEFEVPEFLIPVKNALRVVVNVLLDVGGIGGWFYEDWLSDDEYNKKYPPPKLEPLEMGGEDGLNVQEEKEEELRNDYEKSFHDNSERRRLILEERISHTKSTKRLLDVYLSKFGSKLIEVESKSDLMRDDFKREEEEEMRRKRGDLKNGYKNPLSDSSSSSKTRNIPFKRPISLQENIHLLSMISGVMNDDKIRKSDTEKKNENQNEEEDIISSSPLTISRSSNSLSPLRKNLMASTSTSRSSQKNTEKEDGIDEEEEEEEDWREMFDNLVGGGGNSKSGEDFSEDDQEQSQLWLI